MAEIQGILINRDRPITAGWCGNDSCEHQTHKDRRAAQAAADTKKRKAGKGKVGSHASA